MHVQLPAPASQAHAPFALDADIVGQLDMSRDNHLTLDRMLGTSLPTDKAFLLADLFPAEEEYAFVSMDWCSNWLTLLNANEVRRFTYV